MPATLIERVALRWALDRARVDEGSWTRPPVPQEPVVHSWLDGTKKPTFNQARKIATRLRLPFGFLVLTRPPPNTLRIPGLPDPGQCRGA